MLVGYARVSTADQNPDHQIDALRRAGVAHADIYVDHASGAKASRPQLDTVLHLLRDGDTLKITRLDRLGRSVLHLVTLGVELRERGVGLHVIEQGIDTSTAEGRAMFGMLSVLAELQRELIVANTRDGLAAARARGRKGGRRAKLNPEQIALAQQLYDAGERTVQQIADIFAFDCIFTDDLVARGQVDLLAADEIHDLDDIMGFAANAVIVADSGYAGFRTSDARTCCTTARRTPRSVRSQASSSSSSSSERRSSRVRNPRPAAA